MSQSLNSRFDKNLKALFKVNPLLAAQLQILEPNKKYEVYIGQDPLNINIYDKENKTALYAKEPLVQTLEKMKEFEAFDFFIDRVFNLSDYTSTLQRSIHLCALRGIVELKRTNVLIKANEENKKHFLNVGDISDTYIKYKNLNIFIEFTSYKYVIVLYNF